jgi:hypothetical protein
METETCTVPYRTYCLFGKHKHIAASNESIYIFSTTPYLYSGGQGMFGLPMEAKDVKPEHLQHNFPPPNILEKWHRGEEAEWPPEEEPPAENMELRFAIGTRVECRIGADEWAPGKVLLLWYREPNWPQGSFAPYKIHLDDGREIFAPADMDQIIRLNANPPT